MIFLQLSMQHSAKLRLIHTLEPFVPWFQPFIIFNGLCRHSFRGCRSSDTEYCLLPLTESERLHWTFVDIHGLVHRIDRNRLLDVVLDIISGAGLFGVVEPCIVCGMEGR